MCANPSSNGACKRRITLSMVGQGYSESIDFQDHAYGKLTLVGPANDDCVDVVVGVMV